MTIYEQALETQKKIKEELRCISKELRTLPKENFYCSRSGKYYKWYLSDNNESTYIPKKNRELAVKGARKRYLTERQQELFSELDAIKSYLKNHTSSSKSESILTHPEYQKLLSSYYLPLSQELLNWCNAEYERSTEKPENLKFPAASGINVRSKSETFIVMALCNHQIPFRYECALKFGLTTYYPDFTIRHPKTGETVYWEHCGLIDDPKYMRRTYSKIQDYASHGIYETINLITTFETKDHPFTLEKANKIVEEYFL